MCELAKREVALNALYEAVRTHFKGYLLKGNLLGFLEEREVEHAIEVCYDAGLSVREVINAVYEAL